MSRSLVALFLCAGLAACVHPRPIYIVRRPPPPQEVPTIPPRPKVETPAPAPDPTHVWVGGYWHWDGRDFDWVGGRWLPPRPGYAFVPASYVYVGGSWLYRPCYWQPRGRGGGVVGGAPAGRLGRRGPRGPGAVGGIGYGPNAPPQPGVNAPAPRTRRPAPATTARTRRPAPGVPPATRRTAPRVASTPRPYRHTVRIPHDQIPGRRLRGSMRVASANDGRRPRALRHVNAAALRRRSDYRGRRNGRMVFGNTSPHYRRDHTGAFVLGGYGPSPRRRGVRRAVASRHGGRFVVVTGRRADITRRHGLRSQRASRGGVVFGSRARTRQLRHRRMLLRNPAWRPRSRGYRVTASRRGLRRARPRTIYPSARTYRPRRRDYRRYGYNTRQRTHYARATRRHRVDRTHYRAAYRRAQPRRAYRARSYRRSSYRRSASRSYRRSSHRRSSYRRSATRASRRRRR